MGLEHIIGGTQVSRRDFFKLGALGVGAYLVSQVPAFGQDVARNNNAPVANTGQPTLSFDELKLQGDRYLEARQYPQAIDTYTRALAVQNHEHDPMVLHQRGVSRGFSGDFQGAIQDYEHSLRYNSVNPITRNTLGLSQYRVARDGRNQDLAANAVHNLWMARELAYAQTISLDTYIQDIEGVQIRARTDFPSLNTSEQARGMTREERYFAAKELTRADKRAAIYFFRRVLDESRDDDITREARQAIPILERYLQRRNVQEIAMLR